MIFSEGNFYPIFLINVYCFLTQFCSHKFESFGLIFLIKFFIVPENKFNVFLTQENTSFGQWSISIFWSQSPKHERHIPFSASESVSIEIPLVVPPATVLSGVTVVPCSINLT